MTRQTHSVIGFFGLGAMGAPMARNLVQAGYTVVGYDLNQRRVADAAAHEVMIGAGPADVVQNATWIVTSLPSSQAFVEVTEQILLPHARAGQIIIDVGTTTPSETRRLAAALAERGVVLVDAPVSGGPAGAASRQLYMFVGGDDEPIGRCQPVLDVLAGAGRITRCGPTSSGQIVKGVNQLAMGLSAAAFLEAVAFGVRAGVDAETIRVAVGSETGDDHWRVLLARVAARAVHGEAEQVGVKFRELPYFLREAEAHGFALPLTDLLYRFCDAGERVVVDDNRPAPSFWHELMRDK
jgi:2-hydroxy-3-oxopropionate reductase